MGGVNGGSPADRPCGRAGEGRSMGCSCGPGQGMGPPVHRGPGSRARLAGDGGGAMAAVLRLAVATLRGTRGHAEGTGVPCTPRRARFSWQQRLGEAGVRCSRGGSDGGLRRAWTRGRRGRGSVLRPSTCSSRGGETRACLTSAREVAEREADDGNGARRLRRRRCELRRRLCGSELRLGFRGGADGCGGL